MRSVQEISLPPHPLLRWLADPGPDVPQEVREVLLSQLLANPSTIIMGVFNSVVISLLALALHAGLLYAGFIAADIGLGITRVFVIRKTRRALAAGGGLSVNAYLITGIFWCALQGFIALTNMLSTYPALQILSTMMIFGITGPICARNYPAPRYCMLLVILCDFQFVAGCLLSGSHWLWIVVLETPSYILGTRSAVRTFQRLAIDTLKAEGESRKRATHDPLTGLLNRRGFQEAIAHHAAMDTPCLAVLALDLDGFKQVNDTLGHHVGDLLLEAVAERLSWRVRPTDSVIRLGGDEFVVLLSNVTGEEAGKLADRIIEDVGNLPYRIDGAAMVRVGVTIGIACAPQDGSGTEQLHRRADLALYDAKAAGRGRWQRFCVSMENADAPLA